MTNPSRVAEKILTAIANHEALLVEHGCLDLAQTIIQLLTEYILQQHEELKTR